ncbi:hypothetical protein G4B88_027343 [Cannabis sativa]|uniref:Uncharacterized protein n=1 Tax=Cannabis sativa TaxID=3483 RepID=A0A7J6HQP4_CANSA|nr:hypothetical protein G4B88_027343 [Cannabis sativa]
MGLNFSKQEVILKEDLSLQHHVINYVSKSLYIRNLVSRQRRRMLVEGYDLDMSYITDRLLAMSFPAERMRAMFRNPLWQVKSVLDMRHHEHYKIYNLCIEENYNPSHFHGRVEAFPFDDNHVPQLEMIKLFCRTGLMVCSYLVYSGMSAEEALQLYAHKRTTNNEGVSIPSQRRYVSYWSNSLSFPKGVGNGPPVLYRPPVEVARSCCRQIRKGYQRTESLKYFLNFIGSNEEQEEKPQEKEEEEEEVVEDQQKPPQVVQMDTESPVLYQKACLECYLQKPVQVTGDVRVIFNQKMNGGRLFYVCFNTAFIRNSLLQLSVRELDKVGSKGRSICGPAFCLELLFGPANAKHTCSTCPSDDDDNDNNNNNNGDNDESGNAFGMSEETVDSKF